MRSTPTLDIEAKLAKPMSTHQSDITKFYDLVPFKNAEDQKRARRAAYILTNTYGNRGWVVGIKPRLILIKLHELYALGGANIVMAINQDDWSTEAEMDKLILEKGGELLERANMIRHWPQKGEFEIVTRIPDGFEEHLPKTPKRKVVESVDEVVDIVKQHIKEQKALENVSETRHADDPA